MKSGQIAKTLIEKLGGNFSSSLDIELEQGGSTPSELGCAGSEQLRAGGDQVSPTGAPFSKTGVERV